MSGIICCACSISAISVLQCALKQWHKRLMCFQLISSGLIPVGQSLSKRQTVFFLPVDPMDKSHKDTDEGG